MTPRPWPIAAAVLAACAARPQPYTVIEDAHSARPDEGTVLPPPAVFAAAPPLGGARQADGEGPRRSPAISWNDVLDGPITTLTWSEPLLFVVAAGTVASYRTTDMARLWRASLDAVGPVGVGLETVGIATSRGAVRVDASTGKVQTTLALPAAPVGILVDGDDELLVLANGAVMWGGSSVRVDAVRHAPVRVADHAYAIAGTSELVAVTRDRVAWRRTLPAPAVAGPSADDLRVVVPYAARGSTPGGVAAWSLDGAPVWTAPVSFESAAALALTPFAVLVPGRDGTVTALDLGSGEVIWTAEAPAALATPPIVGPNAAYVGTADGHVVALDWRNGRVLWTLRVGSPVRGDLALVGDHLFVGLQNGRLVRISPGA